MTSYVATPKTIEKEWCIIDMEGVVLGRAAAEIATILRGKHKATFTPFMDCGDNIIVINADKVRLTGNKLSNKKYYWHTGYPGGIKEITPEKLLAKDSTKVIRKAVQGMLSRGPLGRKQLGNLYVYAGSEHPHIAQKPREINLAEKNIKNKR